MKVLKRKLKTHKSQMETKDRLGNWNERKLQGILAIIDMVGNRNPDIDFIFEAGAETMRMCQQNNV